MAVELVAGLSPLKSGLDPTSENVIFCGITGIGRGFSPNSGLYMFEKRVLRRIFGPKRDEVTGEWRKLHNVELNDLCSSPTIVRVINSRRMIWVGHVAGMGEGRDVYRVLVGKPEVKRPLGRPRRRWEDTAPWSR
jgi:hypothetical protein